MNKRPYTLIIDIDGTLIKHSGDICHQYTEEIEILPGVIEKWKEFDIAGHNIILITGRRESNRKFIEEKLQDAGLFWDQLIMGVGGGNRILINDLKPLSEEPTAIAINVRRNTGLKDIKI